MQKSGVLGSVLILSITILILSVSFASASWYSDIWDSLTGNSITGNAVSSGSDAQGNCWVIGNSGTRYDLTNNTVGLKGNPNYFCYNGMMYYCNTATAAQQTDFPTKVVLTSNNQVVGNYKCDLPNARWLAQSVTCTSFTYSAWSECSSSGTQTRTVLTSSPSGCTGGSPILSQSCTYVAPQTNASITQNNSVSNQTIVTSNNTLNQDDSTLAENQTTTSLDNTTNNQNITVSLGLKNYVLSWSSTNEAFYGDSQQPGNAFSDPKLNGYCLVYEYPGVPASADKWCKMLNFSAGQAMKGLHRDHENPRAMWAGTWVFLEPRNLNTDECANKVICFEEYSALNEQQVDSAENLAEVQNTINNTLNNTTPEELKQAATKQVAGAVAFVAVVNSVCQAIFKSKCYFF